MMLLRRVPALATFCVLTSAAAANAECAWVLWHQMGSTAPGTPLEGHWKVLNSFQSAVECKAREARMTRDLSAISATIGAGGHLYTNTYVCLPDTTDPRAPKGK